MARASWVLGGLLLVQAMLLGEARAQDRKAEARAASEKGNALFERRDYSGAIRAFRRAHELVPHHLTQCNIARCHEMRGEHALAARHYRRCLDEGARGTPAEGPAKRGLADSERKLAGARRDERARVVPVRREEPARVVPGHREETRDRPPRRAAGRVAPYPFFAALTLGPALELESLPSQVKLDLSFGYHFFKKATGPALAFDLQFSVASGFLTLELGPRFLWDIPILPEHGFSLAPSIMLGFAHVTQRCPRGNVCFPSRNGLTLQLAFEARLLVADRLLLTFTPIQIDILPSEARDDWVTGVRYDLLFGFGVAF